MTDPVPRSEPKRDSVFLSWSGPVSHEIASILKTWLEDVLQQCDVFVSDQITKGELWTPRLFEQLRSAAFGIIVLTPDNLNEPWVLFEAGIILGAKEKARAAPLLVGLTAGELAGSPLNQLQGVTFTEEDCRRLAASINEATSTPISAERLRRSFDTHWKQLSVRISSVIKDLSARQPGEPDKSPVMKLLEDVLRAVQGVQSSLDERKVTYSITDHFIPAGQVRYENVVFSAADPDRKLVPSVGPRSVSKQGLEN